MQVFTFSRQSPLLARWLFSQGELQDPNHWHPAAPGTTTGWWCSTLTPATRRQGAAKWRWARGLAAPGEALALSGHL